MKHLSCVLSSKETGIEHFGERKNELSIQSGDSSIAIAYVLKGREFWFTAGGGFYMCELVYTCTGSVCHRP